MFIGGGVEPHLISILFIMALCCKGVTVLYTLLILPLLVRELEVYIAIPERFDAPKDRVL